MGGLRGGATDDGFRGLCGMRLLHGWGCGDRGFCEAFTQGQQGGIGAGFGHINHHAESIAGQDEGDLVPMGMGFAALPAGQKGWIARIKDMSSFLIQAWQ